MMGLACRKLRPIEGTFVCRYEKVGRVRALVVVAIRVKSIQEMPN